MKKRLLLLMLCCLLPVGCARNSGSSSDLTENGSLSSEAGAEEGGQTESSAEGFSLPEYDCSGTYYKLEVVPASYHQDAILEYLIPEFDDDMIQQTDSAEGMHYSVEMDGVTHTWLPGENVFLYFNDSVSSGSLTAEEAVSYGNDFVEYFGFDVAENPFIYVRENSYVIEYGFQYEGVPLLNDGGIDLKNEEEDGMAYCPSIQIRVNGNGIISVLLSHLFDCSKVLEEYQGKEDFLDTVRLDTTINTALRIRKGRWEEGGVDCEFEVKEINIIYIPYEEKGKQIIIPVFQVNGSVWLDGDVHEAELMLLDAVSGRIIR